VFTLLRLGVRRFHNSDLTAKIVCKRKAEDLLRGSPASMRNARKLRK
jgi:hypothetical protein